MQIQPITTIRPAEIADGSLAQKSLNGDRVAFERLVQRYSTPLFNFIYRFLGDYDLACDVLQHVLIQLHTMLPTLRTDRPLKAWLFQVARNRCLDELRRKHAITFSELEQYSEDDDHSVLAAMPDPHPSPEELAERSDLRRRLMQAIETLPPKFRSVVMLRYTKQLSFTEIGQALHMPEATAKTYFQRAKLLLRDALAEKVA